MSTNQRHMARENHIRLLSLDAMTLVYTVLMPLSLASVKPPAPLLDGLRNDL